MPAATLSHTSALASLGETIPADKLSVLIGQVISPKNADDAPAAQKALTAAAIRMPDREDCAAQLAAALAKAPVATKIVLLEILAAVGGSNAGSTPVSSIFFIAVASIGFPNKYPCASSHSSTCRNVT